MKRLFKDGLIGCIQKIVIVAILAILVAFIISIKTKVSFGTIAGYMGLGLISLGGLASLGSGSVARDALHQQERVSRSRNYTHKSALEGIGDSYGFAIFMFCVGGIVGLISLIF